MCKTKVLITIGPGSSTPEIFKSLVALASGVRINTAHQSIEEHSQTIDFIRKNSDLPIVLDIKGPEIRVTLESPLELDAGAEFEIGFSGKNFFSYDFSKETAIGAKIIFDDGKLEADLLSFGKNGAKMRACNSHTLKSRKNVHIPLSKLAIPPLSKKDIEEIKLANDKKLEYVALSFARNAKDVLELRKRLDPGIKIIAKVENEEGVENIDEIIAASDGVMVARGDLALDIGKERVPLAQKHIIKKCNSSGKLSITATQVLETMIHNPYPTRAEVSDIANAILDGSDVIMLSEETAMGEHPVKAVETIKAVAREVEVEAKSNVPLDNYESISDAISKSIYTMAGLLPFNQIVSITHSGYTARMISRFRLRNKVIAVTNSEMVRRQLGLYFGVEAVFIPQIPDVKIMPTIAKFLAKKGMMGKEDLALFTAGVRTREKHASNLIEVHRVADLID